MTRLRACAIAPALALACVAAPHAVRAQAALPDGFADQLVVGALDFPVGLAALPDGRVFVIEQFSARVRLIVNGALAATDPVCVVDEVQAPGGEQGLLGIAVDPAWPARPYVYIQCDASVPGHTIRISRYAVTGDLMFTGTGALSIDPASRRDLINDLPDAAANHNGGTLRFGPDGRLYSSVGEDAQPCLAQDDSTLHGVILRLDVSRVPAGPGAPPALDVITPPDNAQVGALNVRRRLIDAWGLRNPFRFQIDPTDGARFIGDVGQNSYEEVDRAAVGGLDFGWPYFEGPAIYDASCDTSSALSAPIAWYDRIGSNGAAVIAGCIYRPLVTASQPFPTSYEGNFFYSDYYSGVLHRLKGSGSSWALAPPVPGQQSPADWGQGFTTVTDYFLAADGSIWYCRQAPGLALFSPGTGEVRHIVYTGGMGGSGVSTPPVVFDRPYPQPSAGAVTLTFHLTTAAAVRLGIFNESGRRVRTLLRGEAQAAGDHPIQWDGVDDRGRLTPSGFYVARLETAVAERSRPIVLVR